MGGEVCRKTIVLVEDNDDDAELAFQALRRQRIDVDITRLRDGVEAIEYLLGGEPRLPTLVLLDLKLPRMDGREVLERLRADPRTRRLPVVMLSSSVERSDLDACYRAGANSYVHKPVEFGRFVDIMGVLGRYWLSLNQPPVADTT